MPKALRLAHFYDLATKKGPLLNCLPFPQKTPIGEAEHYLSNYRGLLQFWGAVHFKGALDQMRCVRNYQYQEFGRALVATITPSL